MQLNKTIILLFLAFSTTACVIADLYEYDEASGMQTAEIILETNWDERTDGIPMPDEYIVRINDKEYTYTALVNKLPEFEPGMYSVCIYNPTTKINVHDDATMASLTAEGDTVTCVPDWLFTATADVNYAPSTDTIKVYMKQQVRQLTMKLIVIEGDASSIASASAKLSGIANSLDFDNNDHEGDGISIHTDFTQEGDTLTAVVRLLGLVDEEQMLSMDIELNDGYMRHAESNLSDVLGNFNVDKHMPLTVETRIKIPTDPTLEITVEDWIDGGESGGDAN